MPINGRMSPPFSVADRLRRSVHSAASGFITVWSPVRHPLVGRSAWREREHAAVGDLDPERPRPQGESVVWWLAVTVVGFIVATAAVIVLGRSSTASWERNKRAVRTRRRRVVREALPSTNALARLRDVVARKAAAMPEVAGPIRRPL